jgi:hypothetical protein
MLFTPGPDEAIEPVILGVAGAVLLTVSAEEIQATTVVGLVIALAFLFTIRALFMPKVRGQG